MRPHTLWTCILDTPWTPVIFPSIFWHISDWYSIISTFSGLFRLFNVRAILHVDRTATATYYQSHRSMLHLFHPSYLRPIISLEIEVFLLISHGHSYYCDTLLSDDYYIVPMIFRCISLFLSFGFAYFHLFIYISYLTLHTKRRIEERFVPPIIWDYCNFTATASYTSYCGF